MSSSAQTKVQLLAKNHSERQMPFAVWLVGTCVNLPKIVARQGVGTPTKNRRNAIVCSFRVLNATENHFAGILSVSAKQESGTKTQQMKIPKWFLKLSCPKVCQVKK